MPESVARSRPTIPLRAAALSLVVWLLLLPPAVAQDDGGQPSAKELRNQYPLHASPQPGEEEARATATAGAPPTPRPQRAQSGGAIAVDLEPLALVILAFAAGFVLARLVRRRWHRDRGGARQGLLAPVPGFAELGNGRAATPQPKRGAAQDVPPVSPPPLPPITDRFWTAEIEWRQSEGSARFRVVARTAGGHGRTPIAESGALEWPPATPAAVQALTDAAERLEASLVAAGWTTLPPGEAWYAKRFAWEPAEDRPAPPPPAAVSPAQAARGRARFARGPAWPDGTESSWRCEIEWEAGYVNSRFKAVVHRRGQQRGREVGSSAAFKWQLMGEPDMSSLQCQTEVRGLAAALEAAGWQHVGMGAEWYSERFVWRGDGEPLDYVEPLPDEARRARDVSSS